MRFLYAQETQLLRDMINLICKKFISFAARDVKFTWVWIDWFPVWVEGIAYKALVQIDFT
jgi:hypothetical protein